MRPAGYGVISSRRPSSSEQSKVRNMKTRLSGVLAAILWLGLCLHQVSGQQSSLGAQQAHLEYEGVLRAYDERADKITIDTGSDKVVLTFTETTDVKACSKNSPYLFYESRGGVLLSIALAHILVGDKVDVTCEALKDKSGIVCTRMTIEAVSVPHSQSHSRLFPAQPRMEDPQFRDQNRLSKGDRPLSELS